MSVTLPLISTIGLVAGSAGQIPVRTDATNWNVSGQSNKAATIRFLNESGCGLKVWTDTNQINEYLGAGGWADYQLDQGTLYLNWSIQYTIPNPPTNYFMLTFYSPGEKVPPMATLGNSPIGGGTSTTVAASNTLTNETNTSPTLVIDIGQVANTNLINIYSDGSFTWTILVGGVTHTLMKGSITGNPLQLGKSGDIAEVMGNLTVDGNTISQNIDAYGASGVNSHAGNITALNGSNIITNSGYFSGGSYHDTAGNDGLVITPGTITRLQNATEVAFQVPASSTIFSAKSFGLLFQAGKYIQFSNGATLVGVSSFTGAAGGTFNHGFGGSPFYISCNTTAVGSETFGYDTVTTTQCHITIGAALAFKAYCFG
jgi:hypothetical protein